MGGCLGIFHEQYVNYKFRDGVWNYGLEDLGRYGNIWPGGWCPDGWFRWRIQLAEALRRWEEASLKETSRGGRILFFSGLCAHIRASSSFDRPLIDYDGALTGVTSPQPPALPNSCLYLCFGAGYRAIAFPLHFLFSRFALLPLDSNQTQPSSSYCSFPAYHFSRSCHTCWSHFSPKDEHVNEQVFFCLFLFLTHHPN